MFRCDRPGLRTWLAWGVLALLSVLLAVPGSAAAGRDVPAGGGFGPGPTPEVALVQEPTVTGARDPAASTLTLTGDCTEITVTVQPFEANYTSTFWHFGTGGTGSLDITNRECRHRRRHSATFRRGNSCSGSSWRTPGTRS